MSEEVKPNINQPEPRTATTGKPITKEKPTAEKKKTSKPASRPPVNFRLFGKWDSNVVVNDLGLRPYINLQPKLIPRSAGSLQKHRFHKSKINLVERVALHLMVSGHQGRKHKLTSGRFGGGYITALRAVEKALDIVEKTENKNPLEVLVRAIENAALAEEIISYQLGSIMARDAVITAPQRRLDKALRNLAQGAYRRRFNKKMSIAESLSQEILGSYKGMESFAVKEKERIEREAMGAR
ncbi:MAG: 30S ribosomal protein S7 [Candidatus Aenigmarchaeota archaeon]|nr:30S ribosomal protein S7 [Candidatus Aenigmarchaeota archaeon]